LINLLEVIGDLKQKCLLSSIGNGLFSSRSSRDWGILEEFKNGNKNEAEFWIQFKGRMIHIRYFAIRDKNKVYKGVIEVSQDITEIQKLSGEKRLLNWD
jgi:hypothetical protein